MNESYLRGFLFQFMFCNYAVKPLTMLNYSVRILMYPFSIYTIIDGEIKSIHGVLAFHYGNCTNRKSKLHFSKKRI